MVIPGILSKKKRDSSPVLGGMKLGNPVWGRGWMKNMNCQKGPMVLEKKKGGAMVQLIQRGTFSGKNRCSWNANKIVSLHLVIINIFCLSLCRSARYVFRNHTWSWINRWSDRFQNRKRLGWPVRTNFINFLRENVKLQHTSKYH